MQQIPHLHLLYTPSCKVAHPFPHFTKEIRASFGNASQNLLLFMQSSKIWILCKWILFWFFWSLCLRESVIFAQCAPCVSRSPLDCDCLSLFPQSLQPACSLQAGVWEGAMLWNPGLVCKAMAGGARSAISHAWWGCRPLGVISSRRSPVTTKPFCSYILNWGDDQFQEVGSPLRCKCVHAHVHEKALHFMTLAMRRVKDLLSPGVVPFTLLAWRQKWAWPTVRVRYNGEKGLVALGYTCTNELLSLFIERK